MQPYSSKPKLKLMEIKKKWDCFILCFLACAPSAYKGIQVVFYFIWIKIYAKTLLTDKDVLSIGFSASVRVSWPLGNKINPFKVTQYLRKLLISHHPAPIPGNCERLSGMHTGLSGWILPSEITDTNIWK